MVPPAVVLRSMTQTAITSQLPQGLETMRAIIAGLPRRGLDSLVEPTTGYESVMWVDGVTPVPLPSSPAAPAAAEKAVAKMAVAAPPAPAAAHGSSVRMVAAGEDEERSRGRVKSAERRRRVGRRVRMLLVVCGGVGLVFAAGYRAAPAAVPP